MIAQLHTTNVVSISSLLKVGVSLQLWASRLTCRVKRQLQISNLCKCAKTIVSVCLCCSSKHLNIACSCKYKTHRKSGQGLRSFQSSLEGLFFTSLEITGLQGKTAGVKWCVNHQLEWLKLLRNCNESAREFMK